MKKISTVLFFGVLLSCCASVTFAQDIPHIRMSHSYTIFAGQGACAAGFMFDAGPLSDRVTNLQISATLVSKEGKKFPVQLDVPSIGGSEANRYQEAVFDSPEACGDDLSVIVNSVSGMINNKKIDLIKSKAFSVLEFKPFKLQIGK